MPFPRIPATTDHVIKDPFINKEILQSHRNGDFRGSSSNDAFYDLLGLVFPETQFSREDTIFTCGPEFTSQARTTILKALHKAHLNTILAQESQKLIERWHNYSESKALFDLTSETRLFASSVITQALFMGCEECEELSDAVFFMNGYLFAKAVGKLQKGDVERFNASCLAFRRIINKIIDSNTAQQLPLFTPSGKHQDTHRFSVAQIQAMSLTMFFAGQETTSFGLDHIVAKLALNPSDQLEILSAIHANQSKSKDRLNYLEIPELRELIDNRLLEIPPVNGIARRLKYNTTLTFEINDERIGKFMRRDERVIPQIASVAKAVLQQKYSDEKTSSKYCHQKASVFGCGNHVCLGRDLALKELSHLPAEILIHFEISTDETIFKYTPQVTNQADPFYIRVKSRERVDAEL